VASKIKQPPRLATGPLGRRRAPVLSARERTLPGATRREHPALSVAFDASYFRRFYESRRSRVYGRDQIDHLARGVTGFAGWFGCDIERVLDVGAGTGLWGQWFRANMPEVQYRAIDVSDYACKKYGHERRDISQWRGRTKYDLVICQGVLPYLPDRACARAIAHMAAMCRGLLYVEAVTARDLREVCDRSRTDVRVLARPATFYRRNLARHFEPLGCGVHHVLGGDKLFYELERA
jgi:SAM-dependent methyltransferase